MRLWQDNFEHHHSAALEKWDDRLGLHTHDDDEVRFVVSGSGSFYMSPGSGSPFTVVVGAGDLISVPRGVSHSFDLCSDNSIRCIRLFTDPAGWAAHYVDQSA